MGNLDHEYKNDFKIEGCEKSIGNQVVNHYLDILDKLYPGDDIFIKGEAGNFLIGLLSMPIQYSQKVMASEHSIEYRYNSADAYQDFFLRVLNDPDLFRQAYVYYRTIGKNDEALKIDLEAAERVLRHIGMPVQHVDYDTPLNESQLSMINRAVGVWKAALGLTPKESA